MELIVNDATKILKKALILDHISLKWNSGRVYGLCGYNGCGKTMLMRLIAGLIRPTSGYVEIDGQRIGKDIDFPESIGLLIENPAFLDSYTGFENLRLIASIKHIASDDDIRRSLERVRLDPSDLRKYKKYSLGMKQRLGIAAAIMEHPDLILLDEPTNALDSDGVALVSQIIKEERERGALIVLACHEREFLCNAADAVIEIDHGRFVGREEGGCE